MTAIDTYRAAFERFVAGRSEPEWLVDRRRRAFERFAATGFPTRKDEDWKYTPVGDFGTVPYDPAARPELEGVDQAVADARFGDEAVLVVIVGGRFDADRSQLGRGGSEIQVRPLSAVLAESASDPFGADVGTGFDALRDAFVTDGVVVDVMPLTERDAPVHVVHVGARSSGLALAATRNIVRLGGHTRVTLVESFVGVAGAEYLHLAGTAARFGDGARLDHVRIQADATAAGRVATDDIVVNRDGTYRSFAFSLGGRLSRDTTNIRVEGAGAHTDVAALYVPGTGQTIDHHTTIDHRAPNCTADQLYKGVLDGDGHGVFNGRVFVRQAAQQTSAEQLNQNLVLSRDARIDTKPQLEIFADDVRCTHGATVGQIDPEELFYMMSRAVPREVARRMIVRGFADDALERVAHVGALQRMRALLDARLGG